MRQFSDDERVIPSIYVANAKQVSYSVVDMLALPEGYERMTEADRAEWFVTHSGLYNGQSVKAVYQPYDWDYRIWRVVMENDSVYEIILEKGTDGFSDITGSYPNSEISH